MRFWVAAGLIFGGCGGEDPVAEPLPAGTATVDPSYRSVQPGESVTLTGTVDDRGYGAADPYWLATAGRLDTSGPVATWTAPWAAGTYQVKVVHPHDARAVATATFDVAFRDVPNEPLADTAYPDGVPLGLGVTALFEWSFWGDRIVGDNGNGVALAFPSDTPPSFTETRIATGQAGYGVTIWDANVYGGVNVLSEVGGGSPSALALFPGGDFVAVAEGAEVVVLESETGLEVWRWDAPDEVVSMAWKPSGGAQLAVGHGGGATVLAFDGGGVVARVEGAGDAGFVFDYEGEWLFGIDSATGRAFVTDAWSWMNVPVEVGDGASDPITSGFVHALDDDPYVFVAHQGGRVRSFAIDGLTERWTVDAGAGARMGQVDWFSAAVWSEAGHSYVQLHDGGVF